MTTPNSSSVQKAKEEREDKEEKDMKDSKDSKEFKDSKEAKEKSKGGHAVETLEDAFVLMLSDMKNAEKQITKALPKMAKAASNPRLAKAFETHLKETERQIELIDKAAQSAQIKLKGEKCDAMEGLLKEGEEAIESAEKGDVRDVLLIAAAQKVEHYEIAGYGCLVAAAEQLGFNEAADLLDQILDQEKHADQILNQLAGREVNQQASMQDFSTQKGSNTMSRYDRQYDDDRRGMRMPQRDDQGRFMSDDQDRDYGRRSYGDDRPSYRNSYEDDDRRYSRSGRDDNYNDNYGYSSSRNDNNYDDDRSYRSSGWGQGEGQGRGWFGDPEGHARAGRHSHDNDYRNSNSNNGYRSSQRDDRSYDDDRSSRSGGRGQGQGWFGDSEGHARAGRHSHDNDYRRSSGGRR